MKSQTTKIQAATALAVILAGSYTFAQSSTVAAPAASAATTSSTSVSELKPVTNKFGFAYVLQSFSTISDQKEFGFGKAPILSEQMLALSYKATDKLKVQANYNYAYTTNRENIRDAGTAGKYAVDAFIFRDPALQATYSTDYTLLGSESITPKAVVYFPLSERSRDGKSSGVYRLDASPTWNITTKFSIDYLLSFRAHTHQDSVKHGNDTILRTITGPSFNINFTDKLNAYYMPYTDIMSKDYFRSSSRADVANGLTHELGMNITVGKLTINPAIESSVDLNDGTGFGRDDSTMYDLNITLAL